MAYLIKISGFAQHIEQETKDLAQSHTTSLANIGTASNKRMYCEVDLHKPLYFHEISLPFSTHFFLLSANIKHKTEKQDCQTCNTNNKKKKKRILCTKKNLPPILRKSNIKYKKIHPG